MDREQIRRRAAAYHARAAVPSDTGWKRLISDGIVPQLAADIDDLLAAIDELEARLKVLGNLHDQDTVEYEAKSAAIDRVLALHSKGFGSPATHGVAWCRECAHLWPCETVRAATDG
jgi:hypothetical protein